MKKEVLGIKAPSDPGVYDKNCPFYGSIGVKGETFVGVLIKKDANHSATIQWKRFVAVPKYERSESRTSTMRVHNPLSVNAQIGDKVLVARTRPISKTKHHVILKVFKEE